MPKFTYKYYDTFDYFEVCENVTLSHILEIVLVLGSTPSRWITAGPLALSRTTNIVKVT